MKRWFVALMIPAFVVTAQELEENAPGPEHYRLLWESSPFTRPLNAAESFVVTGVIRIDEKPVVTILNTATGERFSLSFQPNAQGWRLVELRSDPNPRNVMAVVSINGEQVAVRFNDRQLAPESLLKASDGSPLRIQPVLPRSPGSSLNPRKPVTPSKKKKETRKPKEPKK